MLATVVLGVAASSPVSAFFIGTHRALIAEGIDAVRAVSPKAAFNEWERDQLERGAADADVIEGGWSPGGSRYEARYHFDGHASYATIRENYRDLVDVLRQNSVKKTPDPWEFGKVLHAIQDFYSHSNYIPLYEKYKHGRKELIGSVPTLEEVLLEPKNAPEFAKLLPLLRTGNYPNKNFPPDRESDHGAIVGPGLHKDTWQRDYHTEARRAAQRATTWYLRLYLRDDAAWQECRKLWMAATAPLVPRLKDPFSPKPGIPRDEFHLDHSDPAVRSRRAQSMGRTGSAEAIPSLERLLVQDPSVSVQVSAADALTRLWSPQAELSLAKAVNSNSAAVRAAAIPGFAYLSSKSSLKTLIDATADPDAQVRRATLEALGNRADVDALPAVKRLAKDADARVAAQAAWALGQFRSKEALPALVELLKNHKALEVRQEAALGLSRVRDPQVAPALGALAIAQGENLRLRIAAIKGLTRMYPGDTEAVDIWPLVRDERWEVRAAAALAVAVSLRGDSTAGMKVLLADPQPVVRYAAVTAMGIRPARFSTLLADVAADRNGAADLRIMSLTGLVEAPRSDLEQASVLSKLAALLNREDLVDLQVIGIRMLAQIGTSPALEAIRRFGGEPGLDERVKSALKEVSQ